ncbi:MAG: hypothetical protein IPI65_17475 [Bacteroidetes bacterium]|nr:hypothetical protein [Bacteroidota bacterium]
MVLFTNLYAIGIISDAIGFDSNNGIIYYAGFTADPALCLYAIPVRDTVFSFYKNDFEYYSTN